MSLLSLALAPVQVKTKAKRMATLGPGGLFRKRSDSLFWDKSKSLASTLVWKFCLLGTESLRYGTQRTGSDSQKRGNVRRQCLWAATVSQHCYSTLSYSILTLLPNSPASCLPFPKRNKNLTSIEMRGFNWEAAVARCGRIGKSPSDKACGGLDHYQTMTACLITTL